MKTPRPSKQGRTNCRDCVENTMTGLRRRVEPGDQDVRVAIQDTFEAVGRRRLKAADISGGGREGRNGHHWRGEAKQVASADIDEKIVFVEEIRPQYRLIDQGNLKRMLDPERTKREGHSLGSEARNRRAIGSTERRDLGRKLLLPVCCWKN